MISSSSQALDRGLDSMIVAYSLLGGHPANLPCEQFLRSHSGWFTTPLVMLEVWTVLVRIYNVAPTLATQRLGQLQSLPITQVDLDAATVSLALQLADTYGLDLTDAVLLQITRQCGAKVLATDDSRFAQACAQSGITPQSPINPALRQQIAAWEHTNLTPKGMARVLRRVYDWMCGSHLQAAQDFWHFTGAGSHLP